MPDEEVTEAPGGAIVGEDGVARCPWGTAPLEYRRYHDEEWGRPVADEKRVYEKLCLEGFQSGLSWLTILRKRDAFRSAFAGFDPAIVAGFDETDIERLLGNPGIVRHRGKIEAAIANARAVVSLWAGGTSLAEVVWSHEPRPAPGATRRRAASGPATLEDIPAATNGSQALSSELRLRGFRFVGPTTAYATMQALGVVNDHLTGCHFRALAAQQRAAFKPPRCGLEP
jgi:DNA-3-methyladenine glycosylase I